MVGTNTSLTPPPLLTPPLGPLVLGETAFGTFARPPSAA